VSADGARQGEVVPRNSSRRSQSPKIGMAKDDDNFRAEESTAAQVANQSSQSLSGNPGEDMLASAGVPEHQKRIKKRKLTEEEERAKEEEEGY